LRAMSRAVHPDSIGVACAARLLIDQLRARSSAGTCMHGAVSVVHEHGSSRVLASQHLLTLQLLLRSSSPPTSLWTLVLREAVRRVAPESSALEWDLRSCSLTTVVGSVAQWLGPKASPTLSLCLCLSLSPHSPLHGTATSYTQPAPEKSSEQSVAHAQGSTVPTGRVALRRDDGSDRIRRQCEQGWRGHRAGRCCS
jgi:hypothetical protein